MLRLLFVEEQKGNLEDYLTYKGWVGDCGNHPFCYPMNHWQKKNAKTLIGCQTTIQDLPFLFKILKMNGCKSILHRRILGHSLDKNGQSIL